MVTDRDDRDNLQGFKSVGADVLIWSCANVARREFITLGDSVIIDDFALVVAGQPTRIGSFVHIAGHASLVGGGELEIADFAGISGGARVYTGNDDYLGGCLTGPTVPEPYRTPIRSFVRIGKHCIIGANSVVLPGVTIGEGAVVGACSLVTEDLAPWTVNVGCPTRVVRERQSETILSLEADLREELYDGDGNYIPRALRSNPGTPPAQP
ncbi:MAG: acyltransferase [Planctomycetota bacterium]